jgi:mitochondrial fission protein ELM1
MAPPWPVSSWFDLCVVPEHDGRSGHNIITTRGVLNSIRRDPEAKQADRGLFLLGGPSKHHGWDTAATIARVRQILAASPRIKWTATTSRRSPPDVERALTAIEADNFSFVPLAATEGDWVPRQLGRASYAWVTEDSVSMVYEALTAGAGVGLLPTPRKRRRSRVIRGVDILLQEGYALPYRDDSADLAAFGPAPPLNEAERIANIITARYFSGPPSAPQKQ